MTNKIAKRPNGDNYVSFGNVVDNIFQNSLRRFFDDNFWDAESGMTTGSVPVNIRETEQQYELDIIAPGCHKDDFAIDVHDNILTISLNQKENEKQDEQAGWVRNEYVQRSFSRSFTLDDTVDINNVKAMYADGILHLTLGKNEKAKRISRNIQVQ
jgi:HSP20 family protein